MAAQSNSVGNEAPQRYPHLGKLSIALLEHLINPIIGASAIEEIKKPYAERETIDALGSALMRTENQFLHQYPDKDVAQLFLQLPIHDLPSVKTEIWNFYNYPSDKGLENLLIFHLKQTGGSDEENKKLANVYINILRRELVNADSKLRSKIQALAILEMSDVLKDVKDILSVGKQENTASVQLSSKSNPGPLGENKPLPQYGIITALTKEYAAVRAVLKKTRKYQYRGRGAGQRYVLGEIPANDGGGHLVVLALADMGNNLAASRATQLLEHFPSVEAIVVAGIAGGVPSPSNPGEHVRLGDIVVSSSQGVIQYDMQKELKTEITLRYPPRAPSSVLWEGVRLLSASEILGKQPWIPIINQTLRKLKIERPQDATDILSSTEDPNEFVSHPSDKRRIPGLPRVFIGPIASANILLKDPRKRDELRDRFGVKAVEMEGSGIADATWNLNASYFVVRGICDYCDSNKGDDWQDYAAVVSAGYIYALIASLSSSSRINSEPNLDSKNSRKVNIIRQQKPKKLINNRFQIEKKIDQGNFGVVYKAYDTALNMHVAVKKLKIPFTLKKNEREAITKRFTKEANALATLSHKNIVKILDVGKIGQTPFLAMSYLPGGTLASKLSERFHYSVAARILAPIARALAHAHGEGFLHRDVTPRNIMFANTGEPILTDFGLVRSLKDHGLTQSIEGGFTGTINYAAPEQLEEQTNYQSDIYSLGIIYYQMITGHVPFADNWVKKFSTSYPAEPSSFIADLPERVDQIVLLATARDLENRYNSMDLFATVLEELATKEITDQYGAYASRTENIPSISTSVHDKMSSLIQKFEQEIQARIEEMDFPNAKRLLNVLERFGPEGQHTAKRLQTQIP